MRLLTALIALSGLLALGGCNTVRGIGQDIGQAGSVIQKAAQ